MERTDAIYGAGTHQTRSTKAATARKDSNARTSSSERLPSCALQSFYPAGVVLEFNLPPGTTIRKPAAFVQMEQGLADPIRHG